MKFTLERMRQTVLIIETLSIMLYLYHNAKLGEISFIQMKMKLNSITCKIIIALIGKILHYKGTGTHRFTNASLWLIVDAKGKAV